jgi:hypothetical protein
MPTRRTDFGHPKIARRSAGREARQVDAVGDRVNELGARAESHQMLGERRGVGDEGLDRRVAESHQQPLHTLVTQEVADVPDDRRPSQRQREREQVRLVAVAVHERGGRAPGRAPHGRERRRRPQHAAQQRDDRAPGAPQARPGERSGYPDGLARHTPAGRLDEERAVTQAEQARLVTPTIQTGGQIENAVLGAAELGGGAEVENPPRGGHPATT